MNIRQLNGPNYSFTITWSLVVLSTGFSLASIVFERFLLDYSANSREKLVVASMNGRKKRKFQISRS